MRQWKRLLSAFLLVGVLCSALLITQADESLETPQEDSGKLTVTFYPLDSGLVGDSCVVRFGNTQILIDAGPGKISTLGAIDTIISQMNKALEGDGDKVWEYVIVTHGDSEHITSLSTNDSYDKDTGVIHEMKKRNGVSFDTLIDFDTVKSNGSHLYEFTSQAYQHYTKRRKDSFAHYYTASQICGGKAHDISLGDDCTLTILYNRFYDSEVFSEGTSSSAKANLLSVCTMITYKDTRFLFTGDLEEFDSQNGSTPTDDGYSRRICGETYLVQDNPQYFEKGVSFFKAGHHGSNTSNSDAFIDVIKPQFVVIPTIAGTAEYSANTEANNPNRFPTQKVLSSLLKYTDHILIPSKAIPAEDGSNSGVQDYYGTIVITSDGSFLEATSGSSCDTDGNPVPITETKWFQNNRKDTGGILYTYVFDLPSSMVANGRCSLVKYRQDEVLIDCGIVANGSDYKTINTMYFVDKIKEHCVDGALEYVVIANSQTISMSNTIGTYSGDGPNNDGVFGVFQIEHLIDFGNSTNFSAPSGNSWLKRYYDQRSALIVQGTKHNSGWEAKKDGSVQYTVSTGLKITVLNQNPQVFPKNEADYSVCTLVEFQGEKILFTGSLTNEEDFEVDLANRYKSLLSDVTLFLAGDSGYESSNSEDFLKIVSPEYTVINTTAGIDINGKTYLTKETADRLWFYTDKKDKIRNIFLTSCYNAGKKEAICGDIVFTIRFSNPGTVQKTLECTNKKTLLTESEWYKNN